MATLEFQNSTYTDPKDISMLMTEYGLLYERWGVRDGNIAEDADVLRAYKPEVDRLMKQRGYVTADLVALRPSNPKLAEICAKFDKEHHHSEDEVRFVVEGEGVFALASENEKNDWLKITTEPGDLIVIPKNRRHLFYLTDKKTIRCIRLFQTAEGWQAIYEKN